MCFWALRGHMRFWGWALSSDLLPCAGKNGGDSTAFFILSEFVHVSLGGRVGRATRRAAPHKGSQTRLGKPSHGVALAAESLDLSHKEQASRSFTHVIVWYLNEMNVFSQSLKTKSLWKPQWDSEVAVRPFSHL